MTVSDLRRMQLIIVTGLSGSGKSVALKALEDGAFYTADNLPAKLLPEMVDFLHGAGYLRVAVSIDARSGDTLSQLPQQVNDLKARGIDVRVLFLDAKTDTLVKRFSETRRRHPLSNGDLTVAECIARERELLADIGRVSHHIDTSDLNPNALRAWIKEVVDFDHSGMTLLFQSFGFKHGIPLDADLVFDVRCLPNPYTIHTCARLPARMRRSFPSWRRMRMCFACITTFARLSKTGCRVLSPTTAATSRWRSAARVASIAPFISSRLSRGISPAARACSCGIASCHRDYRHYRDRRGAGRSFYLSA